MPSLHLAVAAVFALGGLWWLAHRLMSACDRANVADWGPRWLNRVDGLNRLYCRYYHRLRAQPLNLPKSGPALVVANHVSGLDALLMIAASPRPLRFVIAAEQYHAFGLNWFFRALGCIPVERQSRPERAFRDARRALENGEVVALFPHGKIHLDSDPPRPLKPGAARLAQLGQCPVYPLRIDGIRSQGRVMAALVIPSKARIRTFPPLSCDELTSRECLDRLERLIG